MKTVTLINNYPPSFSVQLKRVFYDGELIYLVFFVNPIDCDDIKILVENFDYKVFETSEVGEEYLFSVGILVDKVVG